MGNLSARLPRALEIALPIIAAVIIVKVVVSRLSGRPALVGKVKVRCGKDHVFTTIWSPLGSFTAIRLGAPGSSTARSVIIGRLSAQCRAAA